MLKKLIENIANSKHSKIKDSVDDILAAKILVKIDEKKKDILIRQGKRVRKFQRVKGKHVDAKTGREKIISGAEKMKLRKAGIKAARKSKGKRSQSNIKRKRSMSKRFN